MPTLVTLSVCFNEMNYNKCTSKSNNPSRFISNIEDPSERVISLIIWILEGSISVKDALLGCIVVLLEVIFHRGGQAMARIRIT